MTLEKYHLSLGSVLKSEPGETSIDGVGRGKAVCLGIKDGARYYSDSQDGENGVNLEQFGTAAAEGMDLSFRLTAGTETMEYPITATATEGGKILPGGTIMVPEDGCAVYTMVPEDGYSLKAVYINQTRISCGEDTEHPDAPYYTVCGGRFTYTFQNVRDIQAIHAEYAKDIGGCDVDVKTENGEPSEVTVKDGEYELQEGRDYVWGMGEGTQPQVYVTALDTGRYNGVALSDYQPAPEGRITDAQYDATSKTVKIKVQDAERQHLT